MQKTKKVTREQDKSLTKTEKKAKEDDEYSWWKLAFGTDDKKTEKKTEAQ